MSSQSYASKAFTPPPARGWSDTQNNAKRRSSKKSIIAMSAIVVAGGLALTFWPSSDQSPMSSRQIALSRRTSA
jgi:hypothetical protein